MSTQLSQKVLRSLFIPLVFLIAFICKSQPVSAQEHTSHDTEVVENEKHNSHEAEEHTSEEHEGAHQTDTAPLSLLS